MKHEVVLTARAEEELRSASAWIAQRAPEAAAKWFEGFIKALVSLGENPQRCQVARESHRFPYELRQLLFGRRRSYRAVYTIHGDTVVVLTIRHSAQRDIVPEDLP